jgi:hypothetical protein
VTETRSPGARNPDAVRRVADELFITVDQKEWAAARALFIDGSIEVDMSSLAGGGPVRMTADDLISGFRAGLHAGKASQHMATNYRVTAQGDAAELWAHGYAWNRVAAFPPGSDLWETWGNHRLTFRRTPEGWKITAFRYFSKLTRGNDAVRTHTA